MSRNPAKSRPLSENVKRMMWLERASPRNNKVMRSGREFTQNDYAIEDSTKNALASLYKLFGDTSFSAEMVIAELDYSHSHVTATLHRMSWLKVLDCKRGKDNRMTYQFLVTPEDHPECFGTAA